MKIWISLISGGKSYITSPTWSHIDIVPLQTPKIMFMTNFNRDYVGKLWYNFFFILVAVEKTIFEDNSYIYDRK
jgi:hypothetical protein